jgi:hypothetical protein
MATFLNSFILGTLKKMYTFEIVKLRILRIITEMICLKVFNYFFDLQWQNVKLITANHSTVIRTARGAVGISKQRKRIFRQPF